MKRTVAISPRIKTLLPIYFTAMDHESATAGSHQNILLTLQVGLVGIQYISNDQSSNFWMLALVGVALCFLIGPLYEYRVNNVDYWRSEILSLIKGTPLEKTFRAGGYRDWLFGHQGSTLVRPFRHWFTAVFIPLVIFAWCLALTFIPTQRPIAQPPEYQWIFVGVICVVLWAMMLIFLRKKQIVIPLSQIRNTSSQV